MATPENQVIALDAKTGSVLWRYRRSMPEGVVLLHPTSRGVALFGDKVFFAAGDAVLVALDARTGNQVWASQVADNSQGYYMSLAPLIVDGKVMVGASGGELGVRGFVAAFDTTNGRQLWKTYTVPAPGEPATLSRLTPSSPAQVSCSPSSCPANRPLGRTASRIRAQTSAKRSGSQKNRL